jgi:hypothetical protein
MEIRNEKTFLAGKFRKIQILEKFSTVSFQVILVVAWQLLLMKHGVWLGSFQLGDLKIS